MKQEVTQWMFFILQLANLSAALPALAAPNEARLAQRARLDIIGSLATGVLTNSYMPPNSGFIERQTWLPADEQSRTYMVHAPVYPFAWSEGAVRFLPLSNGLVELTLRGPQSPAPNGGFYFEEILWDDIHADGASIPNRSFENLHSGLPTGWNRPFGNATVIAESTSTGAGRNCLRASHDNPLTCSFPVTGGVPVTIWFHARAQIPANYAGMVRLTNTNSPAHQAARKLMRGANLGNYLEAPPGQNWGASYSAADFKWIRQEGFDHVRLPIAWNHYTGDGPDFKLQAAIFQKADFLVTNALKSDLAIIVNLHNFDAFTSNPSAWTNKLYAIWRQVAAHYSNAPGSLVLEILNEPKDAATTAVMNPIYAEVIRQIREISPARTILVGPGMWNKISELGNLRLPDNDDNLIVTVHTYDPFNFTHQGARWAGRDTATLGLVFPGPPSSPIIPAADVSRSTTNWLANYNTLPADLNPSSSLAFRNNLRIARQWSDYYGRPIHVGEFGCFAPFTPRASRVNYYRAMREQLDELGLDWAIWDWKAGFHYWKANGDGGAPDPPGMREALFPERKPAAPAPRNGSL